MVTSSSETMFDVVGVRRRLLLAAKLSRLRSVVCFGLRIHRTKYPDGMRIHFATVKSYVTRLYNRTFIQITRPFMYMYISYRNRLRSVKQYIQFYYSHFTCARDRTKCENCVENCMWQINKNNVFFILCFRYPFASSAYIALVAFPLHIQWKTASIECKWIMRLFLLRP